MSTARSCFVAECLWPSVTDADVDALDRRLALHGRSSIVHLGTTLVAEDDVVFVWFEAISPSEVRDLCLVASVPFDRIVAVTGWPAAISSPRPERTRS